MLPCVLLAGGASVGGLGVAGLDLLADLSLAGPFLLSIGMFITLTFFSQPGGYSLVCQYHPFFFSSHSKMADGFCFLVYVNTNLEGKSKLLSPSGGIREKLRLPTNSCSNEVITACQYLCMARVQRPSLSEPGTITAIKRWLQNSKAMGHKKGRTEVGDSIRKEMASRMS